MRVLFLVSSMGGGGAERVAALLCNAWAARGDAVRLMPTFSGRGEVHYPLDPRVKLDFLADHVEGRRGKLGRLRALRRVYGDWRPDVVVSFLTHVNVAALLAGIGTRVPIIVAERTYPPLLSPPPSPVVSFLRRRLYRRAAAVVVQTRDTEDWIRRECGPCPVMVIPNPVAERRAEAVGGPARAAGPRTVLAVGRLIASKRFELLVDCFADLAQEFPDWRLCILGDGPLRDDLRAQADGLGLGERVCLPGFSSTPWDWYGQADIYVLASAYEGMPNTLLEAMSHGVASVAFDIRSGPRDVMDGGALGLLLPDDAHRERLTAALRRLMADPHLRDELGRMALRVGDTYSMGKVLDLWDEAIRAAMSGKALPGGEGA